MGKDIDCITSLGKGLCKLNQNDTDLYSILLLTYYPENDDSLRTFKLNKEYISFSISGYEVPEGSVRKFKGQDVVVMGMKKAVTNDNVKIRKGPSVTSEELSYIKEPYADGGLKYVPAGTEITVIARTKNKKVS